MSRSPSWPTGRASSPAPDQSVSAETRAVVDALIQLPAAVLLVPATQLLPTLSVLAAGLLGRRHRGLHVLPEPLQRSLRDGGRLAGLTD